MLVSSNSQPDPGFVPRKEFIRDQATTLSSFALLAVSGSSCIRLYSFSPSVITAVRRFLEQRRIFVGLREDAGEGMSEFTLDGKPWANPKAVPTEKLLLDIFTLIYHCGWNYLSDIDYGRENDDKLAIAFSKLGATPQSPSRTGTPLLPSSPPFNDGSQNSFHDKSRNRRVPFALSFASATLMRVIAPPLHLTPAILQAVRGSWPRGVVSEKKVGDNSFEFKLKGYRWFQQDTFTTDTLRHILSLFSSLDGHSFTLLTSLSLSNNRSRFKDLWIFTGPAPEETSLPDTPEHSVLDGCHPGIKRRANSPENPGVSQQMPNLIPQQRRQAPESTMLPLSPHMQQPRTVTDDQQQRQQKSIATPPSSPHGLRKPAPRAQVPVSVVHDDLHDGVRVVLPSTVSSGVENMTGIGAIGQTNPEKYYPASPYNAANSAPSSAANMTDAGSSTKRQNASPPQRAPLRTVSGRAKTPPLLVSQSPPASPSSHKRRNHGSPSPSPSPPHAIGEPPASLLGAGVFRDSSFSSKSEDGYGSPVKWSGRGNDHIGDGHHRPNVDIPTRNRSYSEGRRFSGPLIPGGWQPTPIEEREEEAVVPDGEGVEEKTNQGTRTPVQEVGSLVDSPTIVQSRLPTRKSEAAVVDIFPATAIPPPPMPSPPSPKTMSRSTPRSSPHSQRNLPYMGQQTGQHSPQILSSAPPLTLRPPPQYRKEAQTAVGGGSGGGHGGHGWVLVNVEGATPTSEGSSSVVAPTPVSTPERQGRGAGMKPTSQDPIPSAAKAIVIIDAMESKHKKSRSAADASSPSNRNALSRFFSLSRKNSRKILDGDEQRENEHVLDDRNTTGSGSTIPRNNLRDRLRLLGTPEASRKEGKRRSIE